MEFNGLTLCKWTVELELVFFFVCYCLCSANAYYTHILWIEMVNLLRFYVPHLLSQTIKIRKTLKECLFACFWVATVVCCLIAPLNCIYWKLNVNSSLNKFQTLFLSLSLNDRRNTKNCAAIKLTSIQINK